MQRTEAQLEAVLGNIAEAVTVQRADGALVYVNPTAARMIWNEDPAVIIQTPVEELRSAFLLLDEAARPLDAIDLPNIRALRGEPAEPMLVRAVRRADGEQCWWLIVRGVADDRGEIALAVNIIEDVTRPRRPSSASASSPGPAGACAQPRPRGDAQARRRRGRAMAGRLVRRRPARRRGDIEQVALAHTDPEKVATPCALRRRYRWIPTTRRSFAECCDRRPVRGDRHPGRARAWTGGQDPEHWGDPRPRHRVRD